MRTDRAALLPDALQLAPPLKSSFRATTAETRLDGTGPFTLNLPDLTGGGN